MKSCPILLWKEKTKRVKGDISLCLLVSYLVAISFIRLTVRYGSVVFGTNSHTSWHTEGNNFLGFSVGPALTGSSHMPWLLCELAMCPSEPVCLCMGEAFMPREYHWARLLVGRFCPEPSLLLLLLSPTSLMSTEQVFLLLALLFGQSLPTGTRKRKRSSCAVSASMSPLLFLAPSGTGVLWSQGRDPAFEKLITGQGYCSLCAPFFPSAYSRWRAALWAQHWLALACAHINISFLQGPVYPASGHEEWNSRKKPKVYHGLSLTGLNTSTVFTMAPVLWVFFKG